MKKPATIKKLQLEKQTIRELDKLPPVALVQVAGAGVTRASRANVCCGVF